MKTNSAGLALIKQFEGCKLKSYQDIVGIWTIGYGHTGDDVTPGQKIDQETADSLLAADLSQFEDGVSGCLTTKQGGVTDNQFSALVCFAYNVGLGNLKSSTLLKKLLVGDTTGAANEFLRWNKAGGKEVAGLTRRRAAERALFMS